MGFPLYTNQKGIPEVSEYPYPWRTLNLPKENACCSDIRDRSLITRRGGYNMGKSRVRNFLHPPPPSKQPHTPHTCPISMAKTSSSSVNIPQNLLCPPPLFFSMAKTFSVPPFCKGKTCPPPSHFVASLTLSSDNSNFLYLFISILDADKE